MSQRKFNGESRYYQRGFSSRHNLISDHQFGFFPRYSTNNDAPNTLSQHWSSVLDKGKGAFVAALNIKGAFDQVWHNGQCAKLHASGKLLK